MPIFRKFTWILLIPAVMISDCHFLPSNSHSQEVSLCIDSEMSTLRDMVIQRINLLAREENLLPVGIPPHPDRDIGFATVFISLENKYQKDIKVRVNRVEIRNVSDNTLQPFSQLPQEIHLKPLENSKISFDLTNKTGYIGQDRVKAVVTYQIGDQIKVIESEPVEVDRY